MTDSDPVTLAILLSYDAQSGVIYWRRRPDHFFPTDSRQSQRQCAHNWNRRYAGTRAGSLTTRGYVNIGLEGRLYKAHRIAWCLHYGAWPTRNIDHINGSGADNRIANLRDVPQAENCRNSAMSRRNTSGICGVYWNDAIQKWTASIYEGGRQKHLGVFLDKSAAQAARAAAEERLGYHSNHGRSSRVPKKSPKLRARD